MADGLARHAYDDLGLDSEFDSAVAAVRYSLRIRNKYAHCIWHDDLTGMLGFVNLEDLAGEKDHVPDLKGLVIKYVDVSLLESQLRYFEYASALLIYVNFEGQLRSGKMKSGAFRPPTKVPTPGFHL